MITQTTSIDIDGPKAKAHYDHIVAKWRTACVKSAVSTKAWRAGGRTLRREIERRGCVVKTDESDSETILKFMNKGRIEGILTIALETNEPEPIEQ